jgi:hypothetical protein
MFETLRKSRIESNRKDKQKDCYQGMRGKSYGGELAGHPRPRHYLLYNIAMYQLAVGGPRKHLQKVLCDCLTEYGIK